MKSQGKCLSECLNFNNHHFIYALLELYISLNSQMKAVAGLKMSYQVQQAIKGSKGAVIRGFRHDDLDSALCGHLYTLVRGNRQHRRAFLISLLNLFDDSSVSLSLSFWPILLQFSYILLLRLRFFRFAHPVPVVMFRHSVLYRKRRWPCCCL